MTLEGGRRWLERIGAALSHEAQDGRENLRFGPPVTVPARPRLSDLVPAQPGPEVTWQPTLRSASV